MKLENVTIEKLRFEKDMAFITIGTRIYPVTGRLALVVEKYLTPGNMIDIDMENGAVKSINYKYQG